MQMSLIEQEVLLLLLSQCLTKVQTKRSVVTHNDFSVFFVLLPVKQAVSLCYSVSKKKGSKSSSHVSDYITYCYPKAFIIPTA